MSQKANMVGNDEEIDSDSSEPEMYIDECVDNDEVMPTIEEPSNEIVEINGKKSKRKLSEPAVSPPEPNCIKIRKQHTETEVTETTTKKIDLDKDEQISDLPTTNSWDDSKKHVLIEVTHEDYTQFVEKLSKETTSAADKIVEVEIRNSSYRMTLPFVSPYENMVQKALTTWRAWERQSKFREGILSYICYVCYKGWWHLDPFREHIKCHEGIQVGMDLYNHDCNMVAYVDEKYDKAKNHVIEGPCWQCGKTWNDHNRREKWSKIYYYCKECGDAFMTCAMLLEHEGTCQKYHKINLKNEIRQESDWKCDICNIKYLTKARYDSHLRLKHGVRSDIPSLVSLKTCEHCGGNYPSLYSFHNCPIEYLGFGCTYCYRRFRSKRNVNIHENSSKSNATCSVCKIKLRKQCMEFEHVIQHSDNYVLAHKCLESVTTNCFKVHLSPLSEDLKKTHDLIAIPKQLLLVSKEVASNCDNIDVINANNEEAIIDENRCLVQDIHETEDDEQEIKERTKEDLNETENVIIAKENDEKGTENRLEEPKNDIDEADIDLKEIIELDKSVASILQKKIEDEIKALDELNDKLDNESDIDIKQENDSDLEFQDDILCTTGF